MRLFLGISCLALVSAAAVGAGANAGAPQTAFFQANAAYSDGRFEEAVAAYESIIAAGIDGGHLRFNLGNAYFKTGDVGRAILNYERASRWIPGDPDLDANLTYARSLTGAEACVPPLWANWLFPFASSFPSWQLSMVASCLLALALATLALRRIAGTRGRPSAYLAGICFVMAALVAGSAGYRAVQVELISTVVVVTEGSAPVRFEPAEDGTTHFAAPQGSRLEGGETRPGWAQVARCDGRRGWIEAAAIEAL